MNEAKELEQNIVENQGRMSYAIEFSDVSLNDCVKVAKAYLQLLLAEEERIKCENGTWSI